VSYLKQISGFFEKYTFRITLAICLLLLILRSHERFIFPHLWAEDGSLFLSEAIQYGWKSLFLPYAGYYHTLPRVISYLIHFFPVFLFPQIIFSICLLIYAIIISVFVTEDFSSLLKNKIHRFILCLTFCFVPGLHEVLGNLANLHWILFLYLSLLVLKNNKTNLSLYECFFILLAIFSTGEPVILLPVLFIQLVYFYKFESQVSKRTLLLFIAILFSVILNILQKDKLPSGPSLSIKDLLVGWHYVVQNSLIWQPLVGDKYLLKLYREHWHIYYYGGIGISLLLCGLYFYRICKKNISSVILFLLILMICFIPLLTFIVRPYSFTTFLNLNIVWKLRYGFILAPWGILFLSLTISQIVKESWKTYFFIIFFILTMFLNRYRFLIPAYGKENWFQASKIAEQAIETGCPKKVSIPIYPDGTDGYNVRFYFEFTITDQSYDCK